MPFLSARRALFGDTRSGGSGVGLAAYLDFAVDELLTTDLSQFAQATDYDTCWAARLTNADGSLAYPHLLQTLTERQHPDGSWGSRIPYSHDRVLSTLAVVLLLSLFGSRKRDHEQRSAGVRYIWRQASELKHDVHPTVGFEMILPALLAEGRELGLDLPYAELRHYEAERARKLSVLPDQRLFKTRTTALHSLEAFPGRVNVDDASTLLLEDGSMAGSPSATAWFLGQVPDWRARYPQCTAYLENLLRRNPSGLPAMAPCGIFARTWVLYYLYWGGLLTGRKELLRSHYEYLLDHWHSDGVGFSPSMFPDSDDTSMALLALHRAGYAVDGTPLLAFERDKHFAVFNHELQPSISANLHILEALETLPEHDRWRVREKIIDYAFAERRPGGYWTDKWHSSVYYPTSQALMALLPHAPNRMDDSLNWVLSTQRTDGSWGQYASTVEETALVLLPLLLYHRAGWSLPKQPLRLAARYLLSNQSPFEQNYTELWTAKVLYAPSSIIRSVTLAALGLYQATFKDLG
jgi:halimadienyl-diphosphate synthase